MDSAQGLPPFLAPGALPGLDTALGLTYSAGRPDIYLRMLKRFRDSRGTLRAELLGALAEGDFQTAGRLAHTLKSSAMAIGAVALSGAALGLEEALDAEPPAEYEPLLAPFFVQLEGVLAALRSGLPGDGDIQ